MLIVDNLLSPEDFEQVLALVASAAFASGRNSAGYRTVRVKDNLEVRTDDDVWRARSG